MTDPTTLILEDIGGSCQVLQWGWIEGGYLRYMKFVSLANQMANQKNEATTE